MRKLILIFLLFLIIASLLYYLIPFFLNTPTSKTSTIKPSIGVIQGNGEPSLADLQQIRHILSDRYTLENLYLDTETTIPNRMQCLLWIAPNNSISATDLKKVRAYYEKGGQLLLALNRVEGNLTTFEGFEVNTGIETWLESLGLLLDNRLLIDENCQKIALPHLENGQLIDSPIPFPFVPIIKNFDQHPITENLGPIMMPFCSKINYLGNTNTTFTRLLYSSENTGTVETPIRFDTQKKYTKTDFPSFNLALGVILDNKVTGSQLILFGDGDFPVTGQLGGTHSSNIQLLVRSVDWLMKEEI